MKDKSKGKKKKIRKPKSSSKHYSDSSVASSASDYSNSSSSEDERRHRRKHKKKHKQDYSSDASSSPASSSEDERRKHRKRRRDVDRKDRKKKRKSKKDRRDRDREDENDNEPILSPVDVASAILSKFPELSDDLQQLLKMLDDGQGVDITGLQNKELAAYLKELFRSLRLHQTSKGLFMLPEGATQKTMTILEPCFSSPGANHVVQSDALEETKKDEDVITGSYDVPSRPNVDSKTPNSECPGPAEPKRRVLGPTMPSSEMLEAAAKLTEASVLLREAEEELEFSPLVGPPPPAAVTESESANEAERFEEVERILAPDIENAYELLGLRVGTTPEMLKKRYWKLSLLVHPDKCSHPRAHEAFQALNQGFKDLQDPTKRSIIDQKIEEKETRREFEAELRAKKEAAQWRKLRGVMLVGDEELLNEPQVLKRDEWMTELPPERKPGAPTMQSTFFSKNGKSGRGDTSCWTDTPAEKAQKAKMAYLEAYSQAALTGDTSEKQEPTKKELRPEIAEIMDKFNTAKRGQSLLEKHQAERSKKVKKSSKKSEPAPPPPEWVESHPWKPWDRDKDLAAGRQSVKLDKVSMGAGLSSRFASSHEERSFL